MNTDKRSGFFTDLLTRVPRRNFLRKTLGALAGVGTAATVTNVAAAAEPSEEPIWTPPGVAEPFIGTISMFAGTFAPRGWALCDGQLLAISQNQALFSILGTTYGGDGRTSFGLPDLRGRAPMHAGQGPGLLPRTLGQKASFGAGDAEPRPAFTVVNFIIALQGVYPSRS